MATYAANLSSLEADLVAGLRQRDESAFTELFHTFQERVYRTALRILKEEESARDALQETMINVYRAARTFRGEAKLSTWINRITVNVCLEMIRKNKRHQQRQDDDVSEQNHLEDPRAENPFEVTRQREIARKIRAALDRLSDKHNTVVRLHDLQGYTIKEISEQLEVAQGTIKSRLFYGREELKRQVA